MEYKLTEEEVLHVASLAKIKVSADDIKKYQEDLSKLLTEVEKINEVIGYDDEILISPTSEVCSLRKDDKEEMLDPNEVLKNVPRHSGNYIEVPVVINE